MDNMFQNHGPITEDCPVVEKYKNIVEEVYEGMPAVMDKSMKHAMYQCILNTNKVLTEEVTQTTGIDQYTPVLISLVRRTLPTLVGTEMVGIQPLALPTGKIFVQRIYSEKNGVKNEVWANGTVGTDTSYGAKPDFTLSGPYGTAEGEQLGWKGTSSVEDTSSNTVSALTNPNPYPEMSFGISGITVESKTRALKGRLTTEVIEDLKTVHGLDAIKEIVNILQAELIADIDREIVNKIYTEAKIGARNCATPGLFDFAVDADGRWSVEKVMGLLIQIEREATIIAQETRRGRGNFIITTPELAAYLTMASLITNDYKNTGIEQAVINPVGISYYGILANRYKVFIDPYLASSSVNVTSGESTESKIVHWVVVGFKGATSYDAGIIYCPYVPVQFYQAKDQGAFGEILGVKSRYGLVSNPYYRSGETNDAGANTNSYFRRFSVSVD